MTYIITFFKSIFAVLSVVMMAFTGIGSGNTHQALEAKNSDELLFNAALISDVHIIDKEYIGQGILKKAVGSLNDSKDPVNALLICGDLTTYCDAPSLDRMYKIVTDNLPEDTDLFVTTGNHDIGHARENNITQEEARQNFYKYTNQYLGMDIDKVYFSKVIDGYTFITISDEGENSWDWPVISDEQLKFLDDELAKATAAGDNKPVFVACHWPIDGVNGQDTVWEDGGMDDYSDAVKGILDKYAHKNVFYISGHLHAGANDATVRQLFGVAAVEEVDGIFYVNLPALGSINRYGIPWPGVGYQMEVYKDKVLFRARNYSVSNWYPNFDYSVDLY